MRLFLSHRLPLGFRAGVSVAPHELNRAGTIGGWFKHELTRWDQGPLWLLLIWKLFVLALAVLTYGTVALVAAGITFAVIHFTSN